MQDTHDNAQGNIKNNAPRGKKLRFAPKPKINFITVKYIGLMFMTIAQVANFFAVKHILACPLSEGDALLTALDVIKNFGVLTMPLLLIAMTSSIILKDEKIGKVVIKNLILTLVFYVAEVLIFLFYLVPTVNDILLDFAGAELDSAEIMTDMLGEFSNVNVFIDLFLCSLIYLFFVYEPKNNKVPLVVWRLLTLLPVAFIAASFVINGLVKLKLLHVNFYIGALLPHKKIITYVFFFATILFVKFKDRLYTASKKHRYTSFDEYLASDAAARHHNAFLICLIILLSVVDWGLSHIPDISTWGIGSSYFLFAAVPILFWFDYRMEPKHSCSVKLVPLYYLANYALLAVLYLFFLF